MNPTIDSHHHFWNIERFEYPWLQPKLGVLYRNYLPDDLRPHLERSGVQKTIVVQAQPKTALEETCWLLELADKEDFIAGVVGWMDLTESHVDQFLDMFASRPNLVGIRQLADADADADWQLRDDTLHGLEAVARHDLTYDLLLRPPQIMQVPVIAQRVPELKMVIDHVAKPPIKRGRQEEWLEGMKAAAALPNVYCKLSGLITEADWKHWKPEDLKPYVEKVVELFGFDRLMFGSDWPICLLAGSYERTHEALVEALDAFSDSERAKVFGETAMEFYGVDLTTEIEEVPAAEGALGEP
ncbi:MAG: amidohydrolase family protein [Planctomycetota bacterium]|nr:amidohydrolase family protein [Planctomycetota bacterium]